MTSLDKESQYSALDPKWEVLQPALSTELGPVTPSLSHHKLSAAHVGHAPHQARPRPQSFAQKLRSTGKSVKGKLGE